MVFCITKARFRWCLSDNASLGKVSVASEIGTPCSLTSLTMAASLAKVFGPGLRYGTLLEDDVVSSACCFRLDPDTGLCLALAEAFSSVQDLVEIGGLELDMLNGDGS